MRSGTLRGVRRLASVAVVCAALPLCGPVNMTAQTQSPAKISDAGTTALQTLHDRENSLCPRPSQQCVELNKDFVAVDLAMKVSSKANDDQVSTALAALGNLLAEQGKRETGPERKKAFIEASDQLSILETDVFSVDVAGAEALVKNARDEWKGADSAAQSALNDAIGVLDTLRGGTALPSLAGKDSGGDLNAAKQKLVAAEGVLRAAPIAGTGPAKSDAVQITKAKGNIKNALDILPNAGLGGSSGDNSDGHSGGVPAQKVDAIATATAILNGLLSDVAVPAVTSYDRAHSFSSSDDLDTDLKDAVVYLEQAGTGDTISVDQDAKLDKDCAAGSGDVRLCLDRANQILTSSAGGVSASDPRNKWLDRARRAVARHLDSNRPHARSWPWIASGAMSVLALVLLFMAWRRAVHQALEVTEPAGVISSASETALKKLEEEIETQAGNYRELANEAIDLRRKSDGDEKDIRVLRRQVEQLRDAAAKFDAVGTRSFQSAPEQEATFQGGRLRFDVGPTDPGVVTTPQAAVPERLPQRAREPEEFSGDVRDDYNLAREKGDEAQERFMKFYDRPFSVSCSNLADRTVEDGKLKFKRADRTVFMLVQDKEGMQWLFPQFNVDYRPSHSMMDGIFLYPKGTSENLRLEAPGYLLQSENVWTLEAPGEFVNA